MDTGITATTGITTGTTTGKPLSSSPPTAAARTAYQTRTELASFNGRQPAACLATQTDDAQCLSVDEKRV